MCRIMHSLDDYRVSFGSAAFTQGSVHRSYAESGKMERTEKVNVENSALKALYIPNASVQRRRAGGSNT